VFFNKFLVVERLQGVSRLIIWFLLKGVLESTCFRAFLEKNEVVSSWWHPFWEVFVVMGDK